MQTRDTLDALVTQLRRYGASHLQLTRAFAESLGLHYTDAAALTQIIHCEDGNAPTSPAELAHCLGLSRPAVTACIDRLEKAGHVLRSRESSDRRVVSLRCNPHIYAHAGRFFVPMSREMERLVADLDDGQIAFLLEFLQGATRAIEARDSTEK